MKNPLLVTVLVAAAVGVATSLAAVSFLAAAPDAVDRPVAAAPSGSAGVDVAALRSEFEDELQSLRAENRMLSSRVQELELGQALVSDRRAPVPASDDISAVLKDEEVRETLAALAAGDSELPAGFAEGVRQAFADFREEERRESEERWAEARADELNARIERYTTELGLDNFQAEEMRVILAREQEARAELFAEARESGNWMSMRDEMRTIRDEARESLGLVLTPDQMDQYRDMSRGPGRDRGRGEGGGRDSRGDQTFR